MFKSELDMDRAFTPLAIAVLAVSDTRTLETDTAGALLKSMMEATGLARCEYFNLAAGVVALHRGWKV